MKVLKNYRVLKTGGVEEYSAIDIRYDDTEVFAELPICIIEFGQEFDKPMLLGLNGAGIASVVERNNLIAGLAKTKKIYLNIDDKGLGTISNKITPYFTRLPLEDDETKYLYELRNGQIFVIEPSEVKE